MRLQLGLHTRPDAVDPAWHRMLLRGPRASSQPVPPGTPLLDLFDGQQGQLLVLGAPGAGKTTLIVELAQALTKRAAADGQARLPVVLNVAAWRSGQSLRDWLAPTLRDLLGASKRFAAQLAASDDLLLLLDGLDEVAVDHRAACVSAINAYLTERDLAPPIVVSCRTREYADLGARLVIAGAVELEPLELTAIEQALVDVPAVQGVLQALQIDELAKTPLMVSVLLLTYANQSVSQVMAQALGEQRTSLWAIYILRMLHQRQLEHSKIVLLYLRWLAKYLCEQNETQFLIDNLQPTTLPSRSARQWYRSIKVLTIGSITSSIFAVVFYLIGYLFFAPFAGGLFGLLIGFVFVFRYTQESDWEDFSNKNWFIKRQEQMAWSWPHFWLITRKQVQENIITMIAVFFISAVGYGFIHTPLFGLFIGLGSILIFGVIFGPILGLILSVNEGLQAKDLSDQVAPMQGIRASWRTGIKRIFLATVTGVPGMIAGTKLIELLGPDLGRVENWYR